MPAMSSRAVLAIAAVVAVLGVDPRMVRAGGA
jgi:hypothetical protein